MADVNAIPLIHTSLPDASIAIAKMGCSLRNLQMIIQIIVVYLILIICISQVAEGRGVSTTKLWKMEVIVNLRHGFQFGVAEHEVGDEGAAQIGVLEIAVLLGTEELG